jgi:hypothetical protein
MSLTSARQALLDALTAADIDTYYGWGAFSAPCARVFPAEPWVSLDGLLGGKRTQRWEIWAVAGKADSGATFDELEAMVIAINDACEPLQPFARIEWHRPTSTDMGGTRYLASRGVIETKMEV